MVFESEYTESASCLVSEDNGGDGDGEFFYPGGRSPDKETLEKVNGGDLWMGCKRTFSGHSILYRVVYSI